MNHIAYTVASVTRWGWGEPGYRPGIILVCLLLFIGLVTDGPPAGLIQYVQTQPDLHADYQDVTGMTVSFEALALKAWIMLCVLGVVACFWALEALPVAAASLVVGITLYLFQVFPKDLVAQAHVNDSVIFVFGVLVLAIGFTKSGLVDLFSILFHRLVRNYWQFIFIFCPLLAFTCAFFSAHAVVAMMVPVLMGVYVAARKALGAERARPVAVFLLLSLSFVANVGGPGSPSAGGRNAIMMELLEDRGAGILFRDWLAYGLPFVPVAAILVGFLLWFMMRRHLQSFSLAISWTPGKNQEIGETWRKIVFPGIMLLVAYLWIFHERMFGLGGIALLGTLLLFVTRIIVWRDVHEGVRWSVLAMYMSACALGQGLAVTGAAGWMAQELFESLPAGLTQGTGVLVLVSLLSTLITNVMSDGATVAVLGPVALPLGVQAGIPMWQTGLATSFASSFANVLIVGTPNNAIVYALARDPETGKRLLTAADFVKYGIAVTVISWLTLWLWVFCGYWRWML